MAQPIIAIVGRPNVGKSTLFNKLAGERISIVEDTPGVTRDRIYFEVEWRSKKCMMIDTGGIEPKTDDIILKHMRMPLRWTDFWLTLVPNFLAIPVYLCLVNTKNYWRL